MGTSKVTDPKDIGSTHPKNLNKNASRIMPTIEN